MFYIISQLQDRSKKSSDPTRADPISETTSIPIPMSTPCQQNRWSKDHARQSTIGPLLESVLANPSSFGFPITTWEIAKKRTIRSPRSCLLTATVWLRAQSTTPITNLTKPTYSLRHANWRELLWQLHLGEVPCSLHPLVLSNCTRMKVHGLQCWRRHLA